MAKLKSFLTVFRRKLLFFVIWPLAFKVSSLRPIDEKLILFAFNKNYTKMPDNMTALYDHLLNKGYDCRIILCEMQMCFRNR